LTKEEAYIQKLDGSTGASLKLTVLNPEGRIWTMVAGGGASVVYSDAIAAHGFAHELANYGEYSGAPSEGQTYEYAKTIRKFHAAPLFAKAHFGCSGLDDARHAQRAG
jgi:ATP citrate (pro-S)-lyase